MMKSFMNRFTCILIFMLLLFFLNGNAQQFRMRAFTDVRGTYVVLTWPLIDPEYQYNIYRRSQTKRYPNTPINVKPIIPLTDRLKVEAIIPKDSPEYKLLRNAFSVKGRPFNPYLIYTIEPTDAVRYERLRSFVRSYWKIAATLGCAYLDTDVTRGSTYYYKICRVDRDGRILETIHTDVMVKVGFPKSPPTPTNIIAKAGDSQVFIYWPEITDVEGFNVYREDTGWVRINEKLVTTIFQFDYDGMLLSTDSSWFNGFLHYQRWDDAGFPMTHLMNERHIRGPYNGVSKDYAVSSVNIIGNESPLSEMVTASPLDMTLPLPPADVKVIPRNPDLSLEVQWTKVTRDIRNHVEIPEIAGYRLYRYEDGEDPETDLDAIGTPLIPHPDNPGIFTVKFIDDDGELISAVGEKIYWYRVAAVDAAQNNSALSIAASGYLTDITPPTPPTNVEAFGFDDSIRIDWQLNTEPDMDGYNIYRSLCNFGQWIPCSNDIHIKYGDEIPCSSPFKLIGYISQDSAHALENSDIGKPFFMDYPPNSPVCYAYLVKALDKSQNMSGSWPIPDMANEEIVCQRLRDRTPPEPAFVSKLLARDNSTLIEWIGAPVQDIKAYHVYRADNENGPYAWIGGATVEPYEILTEPYSAPPGYDVGCNEIPLIAHEGMTRGSIRDKGIVPHKIYWYKVVGIDHNGNESSLDKAVPVSTFTFSTDQPSRPVITGITKSSLPCGLEIRWTPPFDASTMRGFTLFRSMLYEGPFYQIGPMILQNSYIDSVVVENVKYWYKVGQIDTIGNLSPLSESMIGEVTP